MSSVHADTQNVLWAAGDVERLAASVLDVLEDPDAATLITADDRIASYPGVTVLHNREGGDR